MHNHVCPACQARTPERIYGKPNLQRWQEPSMFEILTWDQSQLNHKQIKTNNHDVIHPSQADCIYKQTANSHFSSASNKNINRQTNYYCQDHLNPNDHQKAEISPHFKSNHQIGQDQYFISKKNIANQLKSQQYQGKKALKKIVSPKPKQYWKQRQNLNQVKSEENMNQVKSVDNLTKKESEGLIKKFKEQSRWIPNSSFTTYFGKPAFENYGNRNVNTRTGGLVYGNYLYTHNVSPHRGSNHPQHLQTFQTALKRAKTLGTLYPTAPKTLSIFPKINTQLKNCYQFNSSQIFAHRNEMKKLNIKEQRLEKLPKFRLRSYGKDEWNGDENEESERKGERQKLEQKDRKYTNGYESMVGLKIGRRL